MIKSASDLTLVSYGMQGEQGEGGRRVLNYLLEKSCRKTDVLKREGDEG